MHCMHLWITRVFAVATFLLAVAPFAHSQSQPAGQVSHRMSRRSKASANTISVPDAAKSVLGSEPKPKPEGPPPSLVKNPATQSQVDRDHKNLQNALGVANHELWSEVVKLDNTPSVDPSVPEFLRNIQTGPSPQFPDSVSQADAIQAIDYDIEQLNGDFAYLVPKPAPCGATTQRRCPTRPSSKSNVTAPLRMH
jgi:hypothetical protein